VDLYSYSFNTPSWLGAQLKHRSNFTFYLYLKYVISCSSFLYMSPVRSSKASVNWYVRYNIEPERQAAKFDLPIMRSLYAFPAGPRLGTACKPL
jgi:hypothetical protein